MVPRHHGEPLRGRIEPGGAVEVVALGEDRLPGALRAECPGRRRKRRGGVAAPATCTSRTATTHAPSALAPSPPCAHRSPSGGSRVSGRGRCRPDHVAATRVGRPPPRRRTHRGPWPGRGSTLPRRIRGPGCGCSPRRRDPPRPSPSPRTKTTRPPSAGRDSSQYTKAPVGTDVRQRHLSRSGLRGVERRGPAPERCDGGSERRCPPRCPVSRGGGVDRRHVDGAVVTGCHGEWHR